MLNHQVKGKRASAGCDVMDLPWLRSRIGGLSAILPPQPHDGPAVGPSDAVTGSVCGRLASTPGVTDPSRLFSQVSYAGVTE